MIRNELYQPYREECDYGLDECHDPEVRDSSCCLGCWVIDPPQFAKNTEELKNFLQRWSLPANIDGDIVRIAEEDLPKTEYNDILFTIWRLGFEPHVIRSRRNCISTEVQK